MFIIERLIGVSVYSLALIVMCILLAFSTIKCRRILNFYTLLLSLIAYFYDPWVTADLYRIFESMRVFAALEFNVFFELFVANSTTPVSHLLFWIIGKTGFLHLLPALTAFICHTCLFYVLYRMQEMFEIKRTTVAVALLFFMSTGNYFMMISNIRTMLGVSIICFCFFRETVEKKFNWLHILLYLLAAGTHEFVIVIIALRFIIILFFKSIKLSRKLLYAALLLVGWVIVNLKFGNIMDGVMDKANRYMLGGVYSYIWEYVLGMMTLIVGVVSFIAYYRYRKEINSEILDWSKLLVGCFPLAIVFCYEFTIFHRLTTYVSPILIAPLIMVNLKIREKISFNENILGLHSVVIILSSIMLFLACFRGSLCSLKFFVL